MRELKNAVERAMILEEANRAAAGVPAVCRGTTAGGLTAFESVRAVTAAAAAETQLPDGRSLPRLTIPEGGTSLEEVERALVEMAMTQANGNQTHAARLLDISRDALRYKLKKFGLIHAEEDEPAPRADPPDSPPRHRADGSSNPTAPPQPKDG